MGLKPGRVLIQLLVMSMILMLSTLLRVIIATQTNEPFLLGFISFLLFIGTVGIIIIIATDLITKKQVVYTGRIINREGKFIHILRTDNKLKKYRITVPEVLERLEAEQQVRITVTQLTRIPAEITIVDRESK